MPGQTVLDVVIGLAFGFFLVAIASSVVVESIANLTTKRAKYLLRGLRQLLEQEAGRTETADRARFTYERQDRKDERALYADALASTPASSISTTETDGATAPITVERVMGHPLVQPYKQARAGSTTTRNPSYLPSATFSAVLLGLLVPDLAARTTFADVQRTVNALPDSALKTALQTMVATSEGSLSRLRSEVEHWYDGQMDRIGGAYKRWSKRWLVIVGLVVACLFHVDSVGLGYDLWHDQPLRDAVVAAATNDTLCDAGASTEVRKACVTTALADVQSQGLPVGWSQWGGQHQPGSAGGWLALVLGLLLTAAAAALGAPFWFDALNRLGSLRNTGRKPPSTLDSRAG